MPKLYGIKETVTRMRVTHVSYSGDRPGYVEVDNIIDGEGDWYVNPQTGEQWREVIDSDTTEMIEGGDGD